MKPAPEGADDSGPPVPLVAGVTLALMLAVIIWLGVWPGPVLELVRTSVGTL